MQEFLRESGNRFNGTNDIQGSPVPESWFYLKRVIFVREIQLAGQVFEI